MDFIAFSLSFLKFEGQFGRVPRITCLHVFHLEERESLRLESNWEKERKKMSRERKTKEEEKKKNLDHIREKEREREKKKIIISDAIIEYEVDAKQ